MLLLLTESLQRPEVGDTKDKETEENGTADTDGGGATDAGNVGDNGDGGDKEFNNGGTNLFAGNQIPVIGGGSNSWQTVLSNIMQMVNSQNNPASSFIPGGGK